MRRFAELSDPPFTKRTSERGTQSKGKQTNKPTPKPEYRGGGGSRWSLIPFLNTYSHLMRMKQM